MNPQTHIVQFGETLPMISNKYYGDSKYWQELARRNEVFSPYVLMVGQTVYLPDLASLQIGNIINSAPNHTGATMRLGQAFQFLLLVEQLPAVGTTHLVRTYNPVVAISPLNLGDKATAAQIEWAKKNANPKRYGIVARNLTGTATLAQHAIGAETDLLNSRYMSYSAKSYGAATMDGPKAVVIDLAALRRAGGEIFSSAQIIRELKEFAARNPASLKRIQTLIHTIEHFEGEVLGAVNSPSGTVPPSAVSEPNAFHKPYFEEARRLNHLHRQDPKKLAAELAKLEAKYSSALKVAKVFRVCGVIGLVLTVYQLERASERSIKQHSFRPIAAESIRQAGGWSGAWIGVKVGVRAGAFFGIETGPGVIVTAAIGAIIFGMAGYAGGAWIAEHVE